MSITDTTNTVEKITETILDSAAEMAKTLSMDRTKLDEKNQLNWRALCEDELMMLATPEGITIGRVKVQYGEMRTYRFETYSLNGVPLLDKRYPITETGWEHMPIVTSLLDADTVIYSGW